MPRILIADDEKEIVRLLRMYLESDDITVLEACDGLQAVDIARENDIDLALVDIMMPKMDGYQVIKQLRQREKYIPSLVISAKVRAKLRRLSVAAPQALPRNEITAGGLTLDLDECTITRGSEITTLTKAEFKVLALLMGQPRRVFTREQIYESAWYSEGAVDDNTIRVIISRLRDKIGAEHIKTIRGLGYRFEE